MNPPLPPPPLSAMSCLDRREIGCQTDQEEPIDLLFDNIKDYSLIRLDVLGHVLSWNRGAHLLFGFSEEEAIGMHFSRLYTNKDLVVRKPDVELQFAMKHGKFEEEGMRQRKNGSTFIAHVVITPTFNNEGDVTGYAMITHNITHRKQQDERFRLVVEAAPNGMVMVNESGRITLVNTQAERMFGYSRAELLGQELEQLIPERYRHTHPSHRSSFFACPSIRSMGAGRELFGRRKDGSEFPVEIGLNPIQMPEGTAVLSSIVDITERKRVESLEREQLAAQRSAADSRMLASMSHEIRTPLTGVIGCIELLKDYAHNSNADPATQLAEQELFSTIRRCSDALLAVVNDILDFSKLEAGGIKAERIPFQPRQIIDDVASILSMQVKAKGIQLNTKVHPNVPIVVGGDPGRLRQILLNICSNGIKFTEKGTVTITMNFDAGSDCGFPRLMLEVRDTGVGIAPEIQTRLFHPFVQADHSTTRRYGGTGLGLAISKKLVELMQGSIELQSEVGVGSCFKFDLRVDTQLMDHTAHAQEMQQHQQQLQQANFSPEYCANTTLSPQSALVVAQAAAASIQHASAAAAAAVAAGVTPGSSSSSTAALVSTVASSVPLSHPYVAPQSLTVTSVPSPQPKPPGAVWPVALKDCRVLVVDDDVINQKVVAAMLKKLQCVVTVARNGKEALTAVMEGEKKFDIIFMDCEMPVMDGFAATAELRRRGVILPIVAMTANAMMGDRERCLQEGMDEYLSKPLRSTDLETLLNEVRKRSAIQTPGAWNATTQTNSAAANGNTVMATSIPASLTNSTATLTASSSSSAYSPPSSSSSASSSSLDSLAPKLPILPSGHPHVVSHTNGIVKPVPMSHAQLPSLGTASAPSTSSTITSSLHSAVSASSLLSSSTTVNSSHSTAHPNMFHKNDATPTPISTLHANSHSHLAHRINHAELSATGDEPNSANDVNMQM